MNLHVWSHPDIEIRSGALESLGVEICPIPLLWLLAFTHGAVIRTASTVALEAADVSRMNAKRTTSNNTVGFKMSTDQS